jgi:serine/threonine-protein kinase RsbW
VETFPPIDAEAVGDRPQFARITAADPNGIARTRVKFAHWLRDHVQLSNEKFSDLVLAVNEALANAAEFACCSTPDYGTISCIAVYDDLAETLNVRVIDGGGSQQDMAEESRARTGPPIEGLGFRLMRRLADEVEVNTCEWGTQVRLVWTNMVQ